MSHHITNHRHSKTVITVGIQSDNRAVADGIQLIRDKAECLLSTQSPTKKQRKELLESAKSLLQLQASVVQKLPDLIPEECSKYSLKCISSEQEH